MKVSNSDTPKKVASKWLEIDTQFEFANRNCYRLSCILWSL